MGNDLSKHVLCDHEDCGGFYNENETCNICGRPRSSYKKGEGIIGDAVVGFVERVNDTVLRLCKRLGRILLCVLIVGVVLFLLVTIFLVLKKILTWAWS